MFPVPLLLLLLAAGSAEAPGVTARTLAPCYSVDLRPASGSLVSAVGCTVLLMPPRLQGSRTVSWEYRVGMEEGVILTYSSGHPVTSRRYENRTMFNESDLSLQVVLEHGDSRLYRLRSQEEATDWFHLHVVVPLSEPQIVGNSRVKAGGNIKLVCSVVQGKADAYWWKKNGKLLVGSERILFVERNTTLCILRASMNDSGYYTCVVSNAVSQNETSVLLRVHHAANVMLPIVVTCVIIGLFAGVFVWCQRRKDLRNECW